MDFHNEFIKICDNIYNLHSNEFLINHEKLQQWLEIKQRDNFMNMIKQNYIEKKDYIITYPNKNQNNGGHNKQLLLLTICTALKISMNTGSKRHEASNYFVEINKVLLTYNKL